MGEAGLDVDLDDIWVACARTLALSVERGGDAYVHFDGQRLHVADPEYLDPDDSLAQLVLHEICHLLVQGPAQREHADWGLDNTGADPFDEVRERAAVRLQAHLCEGHGLRRFLYPTTIVRPFFEALPRDPLSLHASGHEEDDGSLALARAGATRAGKPPFARALSLALVESADRLGVVRHASGAALDAALRCGECAWRDRAGACAAADRELVVGIDELGCSRFAAALDCLACGACCRSGYDAVPIDADEPVIARHPALVVVRSDGGRDLRRAVLPAGSARVDSIESSEDHCAALEGPGPYRCSIYPDRPRACAELPVASEACLTARRRVGLSLG